MEKTGRGPDRHGGRTPGAGSSAAGGPDAGASAGGTGRGRVAWDAVVLILAPGAVALVLALTLAPNAGTAVVIMAVALIAPAVAAVSLLRRRPRAVTTADRVTLLRVGLIGVLTAAAVLIFAEAIPARSWVLAVVIGVALLLDAVDGWVARHTRSSSASGARLDMEADAAALLVVSLIAAATVGWWAVAIGAMRYLFAAAARIRPALRGELRYSLFRRTVAAIQASVLWVALLPITPVPFAAAVTAIALTLLVLSFARDAIGLERFARTGKTR
ncbi:MULTISPECIES: CDP-alcohol phosphatidyltransferase family protein [unclassified Nesterenkonia]|uniref:CDP-alcohol phosphatidyltransferase family protein n=1 Tax=unclassified Nesterenkonia TaxID=2629769 RepID=UPI001F4C5756|nr:MULTISPECIES: CDP-alcohol phosphatidyltransferase family protein [unclassified Nesterenkonia]MCH8561469.1 CDP-alcohol phosphatidyltransferase family protein [Nesterenkonia sp. DZ6]MCH8563914.1 CDP-alcohol phosphatidyltransferase family protein [Nesterenkonia sp. YGD6]